MDWADNMRARYLKPGFFKNDELGELPLEARVLFQGLWCLADREGRLEDRPRRIKGEIFPYDSYDVDALLSQLARSGFIVRYCGDDGSAFFIQVQNFLKHQHPHQNEPPSAIPAPPDGVPTSANGESASTNGRSPSAIGGRTRAESYTGVLYRSPGPESGARVRAREDERAAPAAALTDVMAEFDAALTGLDGYERDDKLLARLHAAYGERIALDLEAHRIREWLLGPKGRGRRATAPFLHNWLKRELRPVAASPPPTNGMQHGKAPPLDFMGNPRVPGRRYNEFGEPLSANGKFTTDHI